MPRYQYSVAALALLAGMVAAQPSFALGNNLTITNGKEEYSVKKGIFGGKKKVVKDRFGDKYESRKGWFGTGETTAQVLGNGYTKKKGLFGSSTTGSTILGDSITTKKGMFGNRTTQVDMSGITGLVQNVIQAKRNGQSINIPGLGSFGGANGGARSGAGMGMGAGVDANGQPAVPANFDLNNFDLNKGLPNDFGNGAPAQGMGIGATPAIPSDSQLPEVPPRVNNGQY